ncbi:MAG: hypothetical protein AVDCRST_MAG74-814 [uncultured Pyrinomonadaceae bacterium]|uniref:Transmembrane protein n=1 Tax=uncultured Pyrinomonadaceae bacterium TaxID=2283094 RepID=A0A6J4NIT3_9BACT|nr:MAG: hypothetical protein AVDCRST_MAG74-814 [uncultured Pyrinomonadaceae bacterium]
MANVNVNENVSMKNRKTQNRISFLKKRQKIKPQDDAYTRSKSGILFAPGMFFRGSFFSFHVGIVLYSGIVLTNLNSEREKNFERFS